VYEADAIGMEIQPMKNGFVGEKFLVKVFISIANIAHYGASDMRQVHPYLMGPAGGD
jgi:hypothetical protein